MQHLYVMQNEHGLIKIGRSTNVELRRRNLEKTERCRISLVAVLDGAGAREEEYHLALDAHRLMGEWFAGTIKCRSVIGRLLALPAVEWPHRLAPRHAVDGWLEELDHVRHIKSVDRELGRLIRRLENDERNVGDDPNRYYDCDVWTVIWRFENRLRTITWTDTDKNGATVLYGQHEESSKGEPVPRYTTSVADALSLWPFDAPADWAGTALECCIEGLRQRKVWNQTALNNGAESGG